MTETPLLLGGRYQLGEVIGRGGMAEVHAGRDLRLDRIVAIKVLRADLARDPLFQARFRREAQSAAGLNHPAVVAVYDTGEDLLAGHAVPYIVMEYVEGSTLRELLNSGRRLLPERALELTAGVLAALDYSHRHGIVHRDIKPGNVMLTDRGEVKVMDFGIARAVADTASTMTATAAVIGTAQYLSPEQARGETVDARSDLYSTGCLLYELLTGRPPFVGDSPVSVAYQHVREEPRPPSVHDPDITAAVDAITLHSLSKDREVRYQSAADMKADIERALAGEPVHAAPPVREDPTERVVPRTVVLDQPRPRARRPAGPRPPPLPPRAQPRRRRGALFWLLLGLVTLAVFLAAALLGRTLSGGAGTSTAQVRMPGLTGNTEDQARDKLTALDLGLKVRVERQESKQPEGQVTGQDPQAGAGLTPGDAVVLTVSKGAGQVKVPPLKGKSQAEALRLLQEAGLRRGNLDSEDSPEKLGRVLASKPEAGATVDQDSQVDLTVASGRNEVPQVQNRQREDAAAAIRAAGFQVRIQTQPDDDAATGVVLRQNPAGGAREAVGSTVSLVVAVDAEPIESPTPSSPPSPSPSPSPPATSSQPSPTATPTSSPPRTSAPPSRTSAPPSRTGGPGRPPDVSPGAGSGPATG